MSMRLTESLPHGTVLVIYDDTGQSAYCDRNFGYTFYQGSLSVGYLQTRTYTAYVASGCPDLGPPSDPAGTSNPVTLTNVGWLGGITSFAGEPDPSSPMFVELSKPLVWPYAVSVYGRDGYRVMCDHDPGYEGYTRYSTGAQIPPTGSGSYTAVVSADCPTSGFPTQDVRSTYTVTYDHGVVTSTSRGLPLSSDSGCRCGDPVDPETGVLTEPGPSLSVPGAGIDLDFGETYNSWSAANQTPNTPLGPGWADTYAVHITATNCEVDLVTETGFILPFGGGCGAGGAALNLTPPPGSDVALTRNADGSYTAVKHRSLTYRFTPGGFLTDIHDLNGYQVTLAYSGAPSLMNLSTVTDSAGRTLTFSYNSTPQITIVTDTSGRQLRFGYDATGNVASITDPAGRTTQYAYDGLHRLIQITDPRGNSTFNTYDNTHLISQVDPVGRMLNFTYTSSADPSIPNITVVTDSLGHQIRMAFTDGLLSSITHGYGTSAALTTTYTHDPTSFGITSATLGNQTWIATYDTDGDLLTTQDPDGVRDTWTYNNFEEPLTANVNGVATTYNYDSAGNLLTAATKISDTRTATTLYSYDDPANPGRPTQITDPRGNTTTLSYNAFGELTSVIDPVGNQTTGLYTCSPSGSGCRSHVGWVYSAVSPRGNAAGASPSQFTTTYTYNDDGQTLSSLDPAGHRTQYSYNADGDLSQLTDGRGNLTTYQYNADNQQTVTTRADGTTTATTYDAVGNIASQVDGNDHATTYAYDSLNRVISTTTPPTATKPDGITTNYGYGASGNLATVTEPTGSGTQTTTYGYTAARRLASISYSDSSTGHVSYGYDDNGRRTSMRDDTGESAYSYNDAGWLTSLTDGAGNTTTYNYGLDGDPTSITYPNGKSVTRTYDTADQLNSVTDWLGNQTTFAYNPNGDLATITYPNGVTESASYTSTDTVSRFTDTNGSTALADYNYTRDANDALTAVTATGPSAGPTESYGYNSLGQLDHYTTSGGNAASGPLGYDATGNLTALSDGTTQNFDPADELSTSTAPSGATTNYQYNAAGDLTKISRPDGTDTELGYDEADRLTSYHSGPSSAGYSYDGDGLRVAKTVDGTTNHLSYDLVSGSVPLIITDGTHDFIYGPDDLPIEQLAGSNQIQAVATGTAADADGFTNTMRVAFSHPARAGDQILLAINTEAGQTIHTPAGYTIVGDYRTPGGHGVTAVLRKTAAGGENSAIIHFTLGYDYPSKTAIAALYRGVNPDNPVDTTSSAGTGPFSTNITAPSVTTDTDNEQSVWIADAIDNLTDTPNWHLSATEDASTSVRHAASVIADSPDGEQGPTGQLTARLSTPAELELINLTLRPSATPPLYIQHDQQGSTRLLTDGTGNVAGTYNYAPYGTTINHTGTAQTPLRYDGQYQDDESGLYYLRARYYDPTTASFLTRDPIEDLTGQPYQYADGDPMDETDPTGLFWGAVSNWVAGFGDAVTFGGTKQVRRLLNYELNGDMSDVVDECSDFYRWGARGGGIAALGVGGGEWLSARAARAAMAARAAKTAELTVPELEGGSLQEVGGPIWGHGKPAALIGTRSPDVLRGLASRADAVKLRDFYQAAAEAGRGGETAGLRVRLAQEIIDAWG